VINRAEILTSCNPELHEIDYKAPLTVGNSSIAFTVDPTGVQTLAEDYDVNGVPLCTLSNWGWNATEQNQLSDLKETIYTTGITKKEVAYPTDVPENQAHLYAALRENPHRLNLVQIRFLKDGEPITPDRLTNITQTLHVATGEIFSQFTIDGETIKVKTFVSDADVIGISVSGSANLEIELRFPYSSPKMGASDWNQPTKHQTQVQVADQIHIQRHLDTLDYQVDVASTNLELVQQAEHRLVFAITNQDNSDLLVQFNQTEQLNFATSEKANQQRWENFWKEVGFFQVTESELQRRIILSQYLLKAQCSGNLPPQETGLTVNSWSGKFHLEMVPWHEAWLALYNQTEALEPLMDWYHSALPSARKNAQKNGYQGARWLKQIGPDLVESPSPISPLIVWQQPNVLVLLELMYQANPAKPFLETHWELVQETAEFMTSFLAQQDGKYHLESPLLPSQERFGPNNVLDPTFEIEYWHAGLQIASLWAERLEIETDWDDYAEKMAQVDETQDTYVAVTGSQFADVLNDHPSFVGIYGLIPTRMEQEKVAKTLKQVLENWDLPSLWGWDYPMLAMVASRLGDYDEALQILLADDEKNNYLVNGHNYQNQDLPQYLPGNGGLLLAMARLATDFPDKVVCENVRTINF
jgi:tetratricopeptide (TPR) repeat protein